MPPSLPPVTRALSPHNPWPQGSWCPRGSLHRTCTHLAPAHVPSSPHWPSHRAACRVLARRRARSSGGQGRTMNGGIARGCMPLLRVMSAQWRGFTGCGVAWCCPHTGVNTAAAAAAAVRPAHHAFITHYPRAGTLRSSSCATCSPSPRRAWRSAARSSRCAGVQAGMAPAGHGLGSSTQQATGA